MQQLVSQTCSCHFPSSSHWLQAQLLLLRPHQQQRVAWDAVLGSVWALQRLQQWQQMLQPLLQGSPPCGHSCQLLLLLKPCQQYLMPLVKAVRQHLQGLAR
jgi:hypothetical protein